MTIDITPNAKPAPPRASVPEAPRAAAAPEAGTGPRRAAAFSYGEAFSRNIGVLTEGEQEVLRTSRVALAGVGGLYAEALARMGVGRFSVADGDTFEVVNFNRQVGGTLASVGRNKARTIAERIHGVNPEAEIRVLERHVDGANVAAFLDGARIVIDAIEAFVIPPHRLLHREARERGLAVVFAAPLGFSAASLLFGPTGMTSDEYFDWRDGQDGLEQLANLFLGLAPAGLHGGDLDLRSVDLRRRVGPSNIAACLLCAGLVATETARLLLGRPGARFAPDYFQFDANRLRLRAGRLRNGNRNWRQRIRRTVLFRRYLKLHPEERAR